MRKTLGFILLASMPLLAGCGSRTIYLQKGDPVQLRKPIPQAEVWAFDSTGQKVPTKADLPEGKWVMDDPGQ